MAAMYACPHCCERTITVWRKLNAISAFPARCPRCNGLAYVPPGWIGDLLTLALYVILSVGLFVHDLHSRHIFYLLVLVGVALVLGWQAGMRLRPIEPEQVSAAQQRRTRLIALGICLVIASVLLSFLLATIARDYYG